jgi:hypothetical protein
MTSAQGTIVLHREMVRDLLGCCMAELWKRLIDHDRTKLEEPELSVFSKHIGTLSKAEYGTPAYAEQMQLLQEALTHHYSHNRHHPEHFTNGVNGMTIIDLLEMVCDWMAATNYGPNGHIFKSIEFNQKRFAIGDQMISVIKNTAEWLQECAALAHRRYRNERSEGGEDNDQDQPERQAAFR